VKGRMDEAYELLIMMAKDNKEDSGDIKIKILETMDEVESIDKKVRT
jgi:hypothetical protein